MIGWLCGMIRDKSQPGKFVLDVNGVGYDVETSLQTFMRLEANQNRVELHIHTVIREDAMLLYGFLDLEERALFRELIKVNGIGPKMGITILSRTTPDEFIQCIQKQDPLWLTRLPGIGKKTAERLVVEMKDRLELWQVSSSTPNVAKMIIRSDQQEAMSALESLGYKPQEASKIIRQIDDGQKTCEQLIRQALQELSKHVA